MNRTPDFEGNEMKRNPTVRANEHRNKMQLQERVDRNV